MGRKPNLFIVGAPKSGTTAMYEYLKTHPQIYMSPVKEPNFFAKDLTYVRGKPITEQEYFSLFENAKDELCIGEASTSYLYSKVAASEIYKFNPHAKIIIMLRNPVDMIYSYYLHQIYDGVEDIKDFREALQAETERKQIKRIPAGCKIIDILYYREWIKYPEQVKRYLDLFGESQVHIIIYDDFKKYVENVYLRTIEFLGCDKSFRPVRFEKINVHRAFRWEWARRVVNYLNEPKVVNMTRKLIPSRNIRQKVALIINSILIRRGKRPPLPDEIRKELEIEFLPIVEELERLLGRDLSEWKPKNSWNRK